MAEIIGVEDLPTALQTAELVELMVAGANASASRVAPCLAGTAVEWDNATAYAVGDQVVLTAGGSLEATVAGTSGATAPAAPSVLDGTVVDGTVTWKLINPTVDQLAEARLVLVGAVKRWSEAGSGAFQAQAAGPFSVSTDTRQRSGFNLWPSEIERLQDICIGDAVTGGAFELDTMPAGSGIDGVYGEDYWWTGPDSISTVF